MTKVFYDSNFEMFKKAELMVGKKHGGCHVSFYSILDGSLLYRLDAAEPVSDEKMMAIAIDIHNDLIKTGQTKHKHKMTLDEIKQAVLGGKKVYWQAPSYQVIHDSKDQWLIKHVSGRCIGLAWDDETTLNGKAEDFHIM